MIFNGDKKSAVGSGSRQVLRFILPLLIIFFSRHSLFSQPLHYSSTDGSFSSIESILNKKESNFHTAIKPYFQSQINEYVSPDSINFENSNFRNKLFHDNFFKINQENYNITIDPLFAVVPGYDFSSSKSSFESNMGIALRARIQSNLVFSADLLYNYSLFNSYLQPQIEKLHVVPGQGFAHPSGNFSEYMNNSFYLAYKPSSYFTFEAGFGKNFWGDGYRSMILSNNAYNYPYLKIETSVWNLKYVNLWTNFKDIRDSRTSAWSDFYNKYGTFHYLSWNVTKKINVGFFEAIIWQDSDSTGVRGFDPNYVNPVIFFRPVEFSLGSPDNALMGFCFKFKLNDKNIFYGQLVIDDMVISELKNDFKHFLHPKDSTIKYGSWLNKQAFQLGFKSFDIFKIKNLNFQTEINVATPYTYSHRIVHQNYGHFNQPLAHPLGANFRESFSIIRYNTKKWSYEIKFMYAVTGLDSINSHFGQNIYQSTFDSYVSYGNIPVLEYKNHIGQGINTSIIYNEFKVSYLINPKNNLRLETGFITRQQLSSFENTRNNFIYFGIRTSIFNGYYDY